MAYNLTLTNPTYVASPFGQALASGIGDAGAMTGLITTTSTNFTISVRARKTARSALTCVIGQQKYFYIGIDGNGNVQCNYGYSTGEKSMVSSGTAYDDNVFHEIEVDFDANGARLYVDGVLKASNATVWSSATPGGVPGNFTIGQFNGGYTWTGEIDQVAIYNTTQHTAAYTPSSSPISTTAPGIAALWNLNGNGLDTAGQSAPVATALTLTGPTSGTANVASSAFTAALSPTGGTVASTVTVTPSDGGAGGTFSPTSLSLTTAAPSGTFTYTPSSAGTKSISLSNNGSLTNPTAITFTAAATADTTPPTMNGTLSITPTSDGAVVSWSAGSDNVGVTGYKLDRGDGTYFDVGNVLTYTIIGKPSLTSQTINLIDYDQAGNTAATPLTGTYTTLAPPLVNYIDTTKIKFSPCNWNIVSSSSAKTINAGAYFETIFTGSNVMLQWDMTSISNVEVMWRIDKYGPWTIQDMAAQMVLTIPSNTSSFATKPGHFLEVFIKSRTENTLRWSYAMTLNGIFLDSGATLSLPPKAALKGVVFGDSITEGCRTVKPLGTPDQYSHDSFLGWANEYRHLLGAEIGIVGFSAQGWSVGGMGSVPGFGASWNLIYQGVSRTFPSDLDFIEIAHAHNDGANLTVAQVLTPLNAILAATSATTKIILCSALNGSGVTQIQSAIAQCTNPSRCYYITGPGLFTSTNSSDGVHPYGVENITHIAPAKAALIRQFLASSTALTPVSRTVTMTFVNGPSTSPVPAANLTGISVAFYEQSSPGSSVAPVYKTSAGTTDASGVMTFSVMTTLASGATGRLEIRTADGQHYNGPATVS
jgi:hypothetical protein